MMTSNSNLINNKKLISKLFSIPLCVFCYLLFPAESKAQSNIFQGTGNVGIGTIVPGHKLTIENPEPGWMIATKASANDPGEINGIKLFSGYWNEDFKWAGIASVAEDLHSNATGLALYAGQTEWVRISTSGNVGIGTVTPAEKLSVNGNIRAKEVKVETANWPDYVFADGYRLPDLKETEVFIKTNRHLPGMPTAAEVAEEGISLGEINRKLLEKVEELTLYILEQQKTIEMLVEKTKSL